MSPTVFRAEGLRFFFFSREEERMHIERPAEEHLYWPELDVDLTLEIIAHPESYPLVSRGGRDRG